MRLHVAATRAIPAGTLQVWSWSVGAPAAVSRNGSSWDGLLAAQPSLMSRLRVGLRPIADGQLIVPALPMIRRDIGRIDAEGFDGIDHARITVTVVSAQYG